MWKEREMSFFFFFKKDKLSLKLAQRTKKQRNNHIITDPEGSGDSQWVGNTPPIPDSLLYILHSGQVHAPLY